MNRQTSAFPDRTWRVWGWRVPIGVLTLAVVLGASSVAHAAPVDPGRLFFTPAQRARLEAVRARSAPPTGSQGPQTSADVPAPLHYNGVVIRSDGKTTRWIDGTPRRDGAAVSGLKPGQIRADGKVYEPYQVLRPVPPKPAKPGTNESEQP
ncbi:MAG TPA: hypothetical protein VF501_03245 [Thiobacillus sp.]